MNVKKMKFEAGDFLNMVDNRLDRVTFDYNNAYANGDKKKADVAA